ncbi:MAG: hypothetical protein IKF83_00700 [Clostridia bacterium]|nr:hypothetical protein [Clostridia bacterium]
MKYEHTTKAIVGLILGVYLFVNSALVAFGGTQWLPFGNQHSNIWIEMIHYLISVGLIVGPVLIAFGVIGIKRELWVRDFERQAQG